MPALVGILQAKASLKNANVGAKAPEHIGSESAAEFSSKPPMEDRIDRERRTLKKYRRRDTHGYYLHWRRRLSSARASSGRARRNDGCKDKAAQVKILFSLEHQKASIVSMHRPAERNAEREKHAPPNAHGEKTREARAADFAAVENKVRGIRLVFQAPVQQPANDTFFSMHAAKAKTIRPDDYISVSATTANGSAREAKTKVAGRVEAAQPEVAKTQKIKTVFYSAGEIKALEIFQHVAQVQCASVPPAKTKYFAAVVAATQSVRQTTNARITQYAAVPVSDTNIYKQDIRCSKPIPPQGETGAGVYSKAGILHKTDSFRARTNGTYVPAPEKKRQPVKITATAQPPLE